MLKEGEKAPLDITVTDEEGDSVSLRDFLGQKVIVYFYPKDDTPGCTTEACGIRDAWDEFEKLGVPVVGVSPDKEASHQKFISKYDLPFSLFCDPDHELADAFGAWGEKTNYGKTSTGILRSTFILDGKGKICKAFPKVTPDTHAQDLLDALEAL